MRNTITIFKREFGAYFSTPVAAVFIFIFLVALFVLFFLAAMRAFYRGHAPRGQGPQSVVTDR